MKPLRVTTVLAPAALTVALAASMVGCAAGTASQNETSASASSSVAASSSQEQAASSSASTDSNQAGMSIGTDAQGSSSSAQADSQASSQNTTQNTDASNTANQKGGMGGGMNAALDVQPGQTNDKGFTATDSGIAITATLNTADAFTERDLAQEADTASAQTLTVSDGQDVTITEEGVYVISGQASESTIIVEAADTAKVQLVLDNVSITNTDFPAIYVKSADKVFVTLSGSNSLNVTGEFVADGDTNTDAVIYAKDDICLNGAGSLSISSTNNAIEGNDDLKITGGTYQIDAVGNGLSANDSIRIAGGTFTIKAEDGIKAENNDDNELGYIYIQDGTFDITTTDNGIQGYAFVWIDGGTFTINGTECIEGTYVQINGGELNINASDDAINASIKSSVYTPTLEITGGNLNIQMSQGDTDALDSNGYLYIKGGTMNITAQSPFDYAWGAELTGGEVYVNGEQVTEIYDAMAGGMGGGMGSGMGGQMPQDGQTPPDGGMGGRPGGMGGRPDGMGAPNGSTGGSNGNASSTQSTMGTDTGSAA